MKAIVLAGGFATRLRPLTLTNPKPLLPILDRPLLDWILESLKAAGIKEVILSVRYMSDKIKRRYFDGSRLGVEIHYAEEIKPLGDAGPIPKIVEEFSINETFLVVYGDVFSDVDLKEVIKYHKSRASNATLVLTEVDNPERYGVAELDSDGRIVNFIEKPPKSEVRSNLINAGIYVFEPEALKYFPSRTPAKLSKEVIPSLVKAGEIYGYIHRGLWSDIGIPSDYLRANIDALRTYYPEGYVSSRAEVGEITLKQPVYIADNVKVGEGSVLGPYAIVNHGVRLGRGVRVTNSLLLSGSVVDNYTIIRGAIVGEGSYIGRWCRLSEGVVLGDNVVVGDEVFLSRGVVVLPYKEIGGDVFKEGAVIL